MGEKKYKTDQQIIFFLYQVWQVYEKFNFYIIVTDSECRESG